MVLLGAIWALYTCLKVFSLFSIDGLTLKGGKLEATHHGSVLHKNIDEIIYCFERSDINVVVIEDLDRFDIQEIFFRLREINFIIRQSPQVKRPIHFIYALRDEMFTITDKTKFFDLIIPIIPVVNSENSREKLVELLGKRSFNGKPLSDGLTPKLIETVAYHIDEMRLLKNIVNEFDIYTNNLANDGLVLNPNKLFAMVALRNLHPDVYSDLLKRSGVVYRIIEGFPAWGKAQIQQQEIAIVALKKRRESREAEVANDLASLRACVWFELFRRGNLETANALTSEDQTAIPILDFVKDETFERVVQLKRIYPTQYSGRTYGNTKGEAVNPSSVLNDLSYAERVATLETSINEIDEEISGHQQQITKLKTLPFWVSCNDGYGNSFAEQLNGKELIAFLLHRGYLDTDYTDYLGYFYEGSLTQSDKKLTMALARGEMLDVDTPIRNPERVASKLDLDSVDKGKGLLVHLLAELVHPRLDDAVARQEKLSLILKGSRQHLARLCEVIELLPEGSRRDFTRALFKVDPNLVNQLLAYDKASLARENLVLMVLDSLSADEVAQLHGRKGLLLKTINELRDVSKLIPGLASGKMGWAWLKAKPARFRNISDTVTADDLKALVEYGCISVVLPMLKLLCRTLQPDTDATTVSHQRLSGLGLAGFTALIEKASSTYLDELLSQEGTLDESEESLLALIAFPQVDYDRRLEIFERTTCKVSDLDQLPTQLWLAALQSDRISNIGSSTWTFFDGVVIKNDAKASADPERADLGANTVPIFLEFLTRNAAGLSGELWGVEGEEDLQAFLIRNEDFNDDALKTLFASITLAPSVLLNGAIPMSRWKCLHNASFVPFSSEIRDLIAQYDPSMECRYIAHHWLYARETLSLSALPVRLVAYLSHARVGTLSDTLAMWQGITTEMLSTWEGSFEELANTCVRANEERDAFPAKYLPVIMHCLSTAALSLEKRTEMLIQMLKMGCSWADVVQMLPLFAARHKELATKRRVHLSISGEDVRLAEALKLRGFVGVVNYEAKRTVVFSKRNLLAKPEAEEHA